MSDDTGILCRVWELPCERASFAVDDELMGWDGTVAILGEVIARGV